MTLQISCPGWNSCVCLLVTQHRSCSDEILIGNLCLDSSSVWWIWSIIFVVRTIFIFSGKQLVWQAVRALYDLLIFLFIYHHVGNWLSLAGRPGRCISCSVSIPRGPFEICDCLLSSSLDHKSIRIGNAFNCKQLKTATSVPWVSPHVRESGIRNLANFCCWNPESTMVWNPESPLWYGIWNPEGWNPESKRLESRIQIDAGIQNLEAGIRNPGPSWILLHGAMSGMCKSEPPSSFCSFLCLRFSLRFFLAFF